MTRSSCVKPLRSSSMSDRCPSLMCTTGVSNNVVVARRTVSYFLHFAWTNVLWDGSTARIILWFRAQSRETPFLACGRSACRYHMVFHQQFRTDYRSQLLVPRRMRRHAVRHSLLTSLQRADHQVYQQCKVECEILIRGNVLRLHSS